MQNQKVIFENDAGEKLSGIIDSPAGAPRAYALFAHCFTCSKNVRAAHAISRALTGAGIAVLRFDFTGLGQSEGDFVDTNFSSNVSDLLAAARFLEAEHRPASLLVGHSLGGTAVLQAAPSLPSVVAVATIGAPADPAHLKHLFPDAGDELLATGAADVQIGGRPFTIRRQFVDDLEAHDLPEAIGSLKKALLVMHAPLDDIVEIGSASRLFLAAKHPKSFVSLDSADHLLSRREDARYAGRVIAAWAARYLPASAERPGAHEAPLEKRDGAVVARTLIGAFSTEIVADANRFTADEPLSVGGANTGPSPYDLLAAALAACTTMTIRMYAAHKKLGLRSVTAAVSHSRVHAEDCADCDSGAGKIDEFQRVLAFDGELDDATRQRLLEIAERCPVHRTLHNEIRIRTRLGNLGDRDERDSDQENGSP